METSGFVNYSGVPGSVGASELFINSKETFHDSFFTLLHSIVKNIKTSATIIPGFRISISLSFPLGFLNEYSEDRFQLKIQNVFVLLYNVISITCFLILLKDVELIHL